MGLTSDRLRLPLLAVAQAQKEMTHNEALALADLVIQPVVEAIGVTSPPAAPLPGQCWIVGAGATGAWAGHGHALAGWTAGGWRFVEAFDGFAVWSRADECNAHFAEGDWVVGALRGRRVLVNGEQVVGARQPAIPVPSGGGTIDAEARATLATVLAALQFHGLIG